MPNETECGLIVDQCMEQIQHWYDPQGRGCVDFHMALITPPGMQANPALFKQAELPLAIYFPGLGEKSDAVVKLDCNWAAVAPEPFILAAPERPKRTWWFIDDDSHWGWIRGNFCQARVGLYCAWICALASKAGINKRRVGLFGFSAGAYAVTEILAHGSGIQFSGVGLGGVHGHGQGDISKVPQARAYGAAEKFEAFLQRLQRHGGAPWIEATHGVTDQESLLTDAHRIFQALSARQKCLGLPDVSVRELSPQKYDSLPTKKRNRTHHNYFGASFFRKPFFTALFGGAPPDPSEAGQMPINPVQIKAVVDTNVVVQSCNSAIDRTSVRECWNARSVAEQSADLRVPSLSTDGSARHILWDAGSGRKRKWRRFEPKLDEEITRAYAELKGKGSIKVDINNWRYTICFDSMRQIADHSGYSRNLWLADERWA
eukprot:TRINITY_DN32535_c0_g1_i1.p1 TRINITY_DN32535_c0_g1~~TRINITY_DN32535_c0_g1_i1.p1  ORF type:complete len:431 (+),score=56.72 TRINITY_DN32535_c0_g1_i1:68-1360(+)